MAFELSLSDRYEHLLFPYRAQQLQLEDHSICDQHEHRNCRLVEGRQQAMKLNKILSLEGLFLQLLQLWSYS
jgi:hypothetical protein